MRYVVFLFALAGAAASAGLGGYWAWEIHLQPDRRRQDEIEVVRRGDRAWSEYETQLRQRMRAFPILIGAGVLGLLGGILALVHRKYLALVTLLAAGAGPGVLDPMLLLYSGAMIVAGLLALAIGAPPPEESYELEDDDSDPDTFRGPPRRRRRDDD